MTCTEIGMIVDTSKNHERNAVWYMIVIVDMQILIILVSDYYAAECYLK